VLNIELLGFTAQPTISSRCFNFAGIPQVATQQSQGPDLRDPRRLHCICKDLFIL